MLALPYRTVSRADRHHRRTATPYTTSSADTPSRPTSSPRLFRAGYFDGGRIIATAGFRPKTAVAVDPCILTLAGCRGRDRAEAVVSSVLANAIAHDHLLLYRTLEANVGGGRIAFALG